MKPPTRYNLVEKIHIGENEQTNGPPFNAIKYGQIDYWLINNEGKRAVLDVQSRKDIGFDSDHFLLECRLTVTTMCGKEHNSFQTKRYSKPDPMKWKAYNDKVRSLLEGKRCDLDIFTKAILEGADDALDREPREKKRNLSNMKHGKKSRKKMKKRGSVRQRKILQT